MNDTATAGGASGASLIPSTTDAFTYAHLIVIAIFALAVVFAILWGMRLKGRRRAAEHDIAERNVEVEQAAEVAPDAPQPAAPTPAARTASDPVAAPPVTAPASPEPTAEPAPAPAPIAPPPASEPVAASAPLDASPATEAAFAPATTSGDPANESVSTLKGLGPKLATRLGELGITTVGQVATLTDDEAIRLDAQLGPFAGRMTRDRWIEQARFLAAGDTAGFEAVFGRL